MPTPEPIDRAELERLTYDQARMLLATIVPMGPDYAAAYLMERMVTIEAAMAASSTLQKVQIAPEPPAPASAIVPALLALVDHGVPVDVQEMLVRGDGRGMVKPGALLAALRAAAP